MGYLDKAIKLSNLSQEIDYSLYNSNYHFQLFPVFSFTQVFLFVCKNATFSFHSRNFFCTKLKIKQQELSNHAIHVGLSPVKLEFWAQIPDKPYNF